MWIHIIYEFTYYEYISSIVHKGYFHGQDDGNGNSSGDGNADGNGDANCNCDDGNNGYSNGNDKNGMYT